MQRVILQVPMSKELKDRAEKVALEMGFSSLQEAVRVLLNKIANKELLINITEVSK